MQIGSLAPHLPGPAVRGELSGGYGGGKRPPDRGGASGARRGGREGFGIAAREMLETLLAIAGF